MTEAMPPFVVIFLSDSKNVVSLCT